MSVSRKYFGTDGIRGVVGEDPITPEFMMRLGYAAGKVFSKQPSADTSSRAKVLIGKDTRLSGYMLESALQSGLAAAGVDVLLAGPLPTPGVAYLTRVLRLNAGIVISASHNPYQDNGVKFFSSEGNKLSDSTELDIEQHLIKGMDGVISENIGKAKRVVDAVGRYAEFCKSTFPQNCDLSGMRIVLDCAHGATYQVAPAVFRELGATVIVMGDAPDGTNINLNCGTLFPDAVRERVFSEKADIGISFDGDGDRLTMVDADGTVFDGDQLLYVIASHRKLSDQGGVVGTLMTNLAIENGFKALNIPFVRSAVGDRYVHEKLIENQWVLGGEGSGHIICLDKHTTGDGLVSSLQVLAVLRERSVSLGQCLSSVELYPQILHNLRLKDKLNQGQIAQVKTLGEAVENHLGPEYRVLIRESGTEPLLRIMVEGRRLEIVQNAVQDLTQSIGALILET
ncbi:MAG: phosphoglucosamine mutase [Proteobacteria bacterium]|nr:phosphoglucosamine mutase [Pseudomonadota bacterium]MDA0861533.1 phosphoglucosamine mutase [Pseudomonadota bacterium]MDA1031146.1 phosphoglucosamine mutase [Pseudomonadota bacterium]